jgi:hypothetical protein
VRSTTTTQDGPNAPAVTQQEVPYFEAGGHEVHAERAAAQGCLELGSSRFAAQVNDRSRRIEDVSESQSEVDRLYRERMEDEYAKREGGA